MQALFEGFASWQVSWALVGMALKNTMLFKPCFITFHSMYLFNKLYRWTQNYIKHVSCIWTFFSLSIHLLSIHFGFRCEEKVNYSSWRNEKKAFSFHMIYLFFNSTLSPPGVSFLFYDFCRLLNRLSGPRVQRTQIRW